MFVRTKDNKIIDVNKLKSYGHDVKIVGNVLQEFIKGAVAPFQTYEIIKKSENLEELMIVGDLILKTTGELFFIPNEYAVDYYIKHHSIRRLWAKQFEVDYKLIMYTDESGKLCLRGDEL